MKTVNNRAAWASAYQFHSEAVEKLDRMEQGSFWEWFHDSMMEVVNTQGNGPLIMALCIAVFDDLEQRDKGREHKEKGEDDEH